MKNTEINKNQGRNPAQYERNAKVLIYVVIVCIVITVIIAMLKGGSL